MVLEYLLASSSKRTTSFAFPLFGFILIFQFSTYVKIEKHLTQPPGSETFPTTVTTQTRKPFQYNSSAVSPATGSAIETVIF